MNLSDNWHHGADRRERTETEIFRPSRRATTSRTAAGAYRLGTVWEILDEAGLTIHRDMDVAQHLAGYRVGFSIPPAVRDAEARSS